MKNKAKIHIRTILTTIALSITLFATGFSSLAKEAYTTTDGVEVEIGGILYNEPYKHINDMDIAYRTTGFTFYLYTFVPANKKQQAVDETTFDYGTTLYGDGTWQFPRCSFYLSDGIEAAEFDEGIVYLNKFYIPSGTFLLDNIYYINSQLAGGEYNYFATNATEDGYYAFGDFDSFMDLEKTYLTTDDSFIMLGVRLCEKEPEGYTEFLQEQETQLMGEAPKVEVIEDTSAELIKETEIAADNQQVQIDVVTEEIKEVVPEVIEEPEKKPNIKGIVIGGVAILGLAIIAILFGKKKNE